VLDWRNMGESDSRRIGYSSAALGIKQPSLSRLESQHDMQVSTLQRLVKALGGEVELIAHLPGGTIRIRQFEDVAWCTVDG
jgi:hypothetical protein